MTALAHLCTGDFRNEGWTLAGSGVARLFHCWNNDDDTKYCRNPPHKGRACVSFPIDITTVPDGAVITSITIFLRCNKTDSGSRSVTVNVSCTDDTSRFTSRTIYPTAGITTYEIATYERDPLGNKWDIHRLNKILCQVFSYSGVFDCVRCYKLSVQINYRVRPTVTVEAPTGTVLTPSPTVSWTYAQADGDPQSKAEYRIFTGIQAADSVFSPGGTPPVFSATVTGDITSVVVPTSLNPDNYAVYVRVYSSFLAKSLWVGRTFSVQGPSPGVPGDDHTISGTPGVGVVNVVPDSYSSSVSLSLRDSSNLLSVQQADFETTTDTIDYTTTNCTFVQDTSVSFGGVGSGKMTASSAATMSVQGCMVRAYPGSPVTGRVQFRAAATGRTTHVRVYFYDDAFTLLSGTITGTGTDATSTWRETTVTGTTPTGTEWARIEHEIVSPANGEIHNVDRAGIMYGTGALWSDGGHSSRNLLGAFSATGDDPVGPNWTAATGSAVSRVNTLGTGSNGVLTKRLSYTGITPTLAFRATSTAFNSATSGADYTLNKPAGLTTGDLMIAYVSSNQAGTITPPAGWTAVNTASIDDGTTDTALFVMKRTATGSEPSTWTDGLLSVLSTRRYAVVVAYSGAADAATQFIAENISVRAADTPLYLTSATVNNTDVNAWRVSAFAVSDNATGGSMTANIQPPSAVPPIAYVGKATGWGTTSTGGDYTLNRPSGVVSGDLMIATLGVAGSVTVSAPSGWTIVHQATQSDPDVPVTLAIMKRTAGGSEAASWSGTLSTAGSVRVGEVLAYRNCDVAANQFIAENTSGSASGNTVTTATVTNTDSSAWRVMSAAAAALGGMGWSTNEVSERTDEYETYFWSGLSTGVMTADSNGPVGAGTHNRTATLNQSYYAAVSWVGLIKPLVSAPSPGANETERADSTTGSADPWITTAVYDSGGVVAAGSMSVTGVFTPGSGSSIGSAASWVGLVRPAVPLVSGTAAATMPSPVDISLMDPRILELAGRKVSFLSAFLGSTAGTPYLTLDFYRANALIQSRTVQGSSFNTSVWTASGGTFDIPADTTRINGTVSATDRAPGDLVYFDRIGIMLGDTRIWRNGTDRTAHAVWHAPEIQYADDDGSGYTPWRTLPGLAAHPPVFDPLSGLMSYTDNTVVPLTNRKYRAQTVSYGLQGDRFVSGYGPDSDEVSLVASNWWLKDLQDPDNNIILRVHVPAGPVTVGTTSTSVVYQPLGEDYPVVVTEGYKGDSFDLTLVLDRLEHAQLKAMLRRGRTLFLQSGVDHAWWVRSVGDLSAAIQYTGQRRTNPVRFFKITFVQVAPEE